MATMHQSPGKSAGAIALFLFLVILPIVGQILAIGYIIADDYNFFLKLVWLAMVIFVPILGPLVYFILLQRRNRIFPSFT